MSVVHIDAGFLIKAVSIEGWERSMLFELVSDDVHIRMSAIAWYEFSVGPRTPEQLALAAVIIEPEDIIPFTVELAEQAGRLYRSLSPDRRRASVVAIATTALVEAAVLYTANPNMFGDFKGLQIAQ